MKVFDWDKDRTKEDGTFDVKFPAKAGLHTVGVTFLATNYAPGNDLDQHFLRSTIETGGLPGFKFFPHVGQDPDRRPLQSEGRERHGEPAEDLRLPPELARRRSRLRQTDRDHAGAAGAAASGDGAGYRDADEFLSAGAQGRRASISGIEMALRRILVDPEFVFRKEVEPASAPAGKPYRISDLELASRLSFFLWSSIPDDELLNVASQNKLHEPVGAGAAGAADAGGPRARMRWC